MYNFISVGFPAYLILFELLLRSLLSVDTSSFIGPTLAASGLGLLINVVKPKSVELDQATMAQIQAKGQKVKIISSSDQTLINWAWFLILIELLLWYGACVMALKDAIETFYRIPIPIIMGSVNYLIGILLTTIKEMI